MFVPFLPEAIEFDRVSLRAAHIGVEVVNVGLPESLVVGKCSENDCINAIEVGSEDAEEGQGLLQVVSGVVGPGKVDSQDGIDRGMNWTSRLNAAPLSDGVILSSSVGGLGKSDSDSSTWHTRESDSDDSIGRGVPAPVGLVAGDTAAVDQIFLHHASDVSTELDQSFVSRTARVAIDLDISTVRSHDLVSHGKHPDREEPS